MECQRRFLHTDGRMLQAHTKLQELGDLRGIDYLQSGNVYPEIGSDLAGLSALKVKIDEVSPGSMLTISTGVLAVSKSCSCSWDHCHYYQYVGFCLHQCKRHMALACSYASCCPALRVGSIRCFWIQLRSA